MREEEEEDGGMETEEGEKSKEGLFFEVDSRLCGLITEAVVNEQETTRRWRDVGPKLSTMMDL